MLSVRNLTVGPADSTHPAILNDISFDLASHEILGIFAETGGGKSVLSRALANWLPPTLAFRGGDIRFKGRSTLTGGGHSMLRPGREIAYIGSRPQSSLDPTIPVGPQLVEKLRAVRPEMSAGEARQKILKLLAEVRIPSPEERFNEYPTKYSGGMMQRAMIVDALCTDPAVIIADNVTQPLDVTIALQIVRLLKQLARQHGVSVLFLSSSLSTLNQLADRVVVLQNGKVAEIGETQALINSPATPYTRSIIDQIPRIWMSTAAPAVSTRSADQPIMSVRDVKRTYYVRRPGYLNSYNSVQAVRCVTFDVMPRDNIGIVGESGCGKSTLTRLLTALENPEQGEILFNNRPFNDMSQKELTAARRRFQLLLQDPNNSQPPRMTVGRMIEEGLRIHGIGNGAEMRSRVEQVMADVGLPSGIYNHLPNSLSTGDRQRISVARALVLEPQLLILDETISALDQSEQNKLLALFSRLQAEKNLTYIFISHDLAMVRRVCSRIAVMYLGELVETADNRNLFYSARHPYTKALLSAVPTVENNPYDSAKLLLEGEPPSPINIAPGCSFASRCPFAMPVCLEKAPALTAVAPGSAVACHLYDANEVPQPAATEFRPHNTELH
ncbi:MAG: ABC transporter ATP-binding protein [Aestuariivirga sp.]